MERLFLGLLAANHEPFGIAPRISRKRPKADTDWDVSSAIERRRLKEQLEAVAGPRARCARKSPRPRPSKSAYTATRSATKRGPLPTHPGDRTYLRRLFVFRLCAKAAGYK